MLAQKTTPTEQMDESDAEESDDEADSTSLNQVLAQLEAARASLPAGFAPKPNEFEKDDDTNFHMDFISAFGNLRARNYGIEEIDKLSLIHI